jgi:dihydropteroate synthase
MGVLNITPDSFYESSRYQHLDLALERAEAMQKEGAAILDVGGESARPGAVPISIQQEMDRVIPVVEEFTKNFSAIISVDTRHPEIMREAIRVGAHLINDINALQSEEALKIVAQSKAAVCLMHMQGEPHSMQQNPQYKNVVEEVKTFLQQRVEACLKAGIARERIIIDPGFGFGKTLQHNLDLLNHLNKIQFQNYPLLVGFSRKSMIGAILGVAEEERLAGSLALATIAAMKGASIIRTHDVKPTLHAIKIVNSLLK